METNADYVTIHHDDSGHILRGPIEIQYRDPYGTLKTRIRPLYQWQDEQWVALDIVGWERMTGTII